MLMIIVPLVGHNETIHNLLKFIKVLLSVDILSQPINVKEFMQVTIGVYDTQYTANVYLTHGERTKLQATGSLQVQMKSWLVGNVFLVARQFKNKPPLMCSLTSSPLGHSGSCCGCVSARVPVMLQSVFTSTLLNEGVGLNS